jgi:cell wall-active antibiotic response 4TMS protein YvqF
MSSGPGDPQPPPPPSAPGPGASRAEWRAWRRQQREYVRSHWAGGYGAWGWGSGFGWFWGVALVLIGVYYLLSNLGLLTWLRSDILWPILIILLGVMLLVRRGRGW